MSEVVTGLRHIKGLLAADTDNLMKSVTGVYQDAAPPEATYPFVIIASPSDGADVLAMDGTHIMSDLTYQVKAVGQGGSYAPLEAIAERIKILLHRTSGAAGHGAVYECVQVGPLAYREDAQNAVYVHLGGFYELIARG